MAIRQEKRPDAPHPEVQETDYGAKFVKAATETKDEPELRTSDMPTVEPEAVQTQKTNDEAAPAEVNDKKPNEEPKKKAGRPKKQKK